MPCNPDTRLSAHGTAAPCRSSTRPASLVLRPYSCCCLLGLLYRPVIRFTELPALDDFALSRREASTLRWREPQRLLHIVAQLEPTFRRTAQVAFLDAGLDCIHACAVRFYCLVMLLLTHVAGLLLCLGGFLLMHRSGQLVGA